MMCTISGPVSGTSSATSRVRLYRAFAPRRLLSAAMKVFSSHTTINAPAERIWAFLTDGQAYPSWNSTIEKFEGNITEGQTIKLFVKINPGRSFPVKVVELEPNKRMVWRGGMPLGLFKGIRTFTLTPTESGAVAFDMREVFSGPLSPIFGRMIPDLQPAFDDFAADLKRAAEATPG